MPESANLRAEIKTVIMTQNDAYIEFHNGSVIKVVTANDRARGNRSNIIVIDEFRMVDRDIINTVLRKFNTTSRQPRYLSRPEYAHLQERNKEIYLSSAFYKSHWSFEKVKAFAKGMLDDSKRYFVCGLPYQLSIREGLLSSEQVADEMSESDFNEVQWQMEMESLWFGDTDGSFFDFDTIVKNRKVQYPMIPGGLLPGLLDKRLRVTPKQPGEMRILSDDVALMPSKKNNNDASALFINQLIPTKTNRYISNIVYPETTEGAHTEDQALRIRRLFEEYDCDYIGLDCKGVGFGIFDALVRDITDPDTGEIYPALSCCNNPEMAERCNVPGAKKVIWAINATAKFNSDCAILLREGFRQGKIRLLVSEYEAEELLGGLKGYAALTPGERIRLQLPYVNTSLLINELVNLQHDESSGLVKISERSGMRKDRYSSLSYNYWIACQLEGRLNKKREEFTATDLFMYRAPKIK